MFDDLPNVLANGSMTKRRSQNMIGNSERGTDIGSREVLGRDTSDNFGPPMELTGGKNNIEIAHRSDVIGISSSWRQ